ncbi:MAG: Smr/MutS family protein [Oscillospiraceae bacterium]|nr:Smr/MutS family protein [Oscillospiraceae bacterium]
MTRFLSNQKAEIDVHSMHKEEARRYIERFLTRANGSVKEVTIIHGCTSGTVLRDMVRKGLRHPRIKSKVVGLNDGVTILILT